MENILIMAGTYYPDSMATIGITQRLAEDLVKKGYSVTVYTVRYCGYMNPGYPKLHNGVEICDTDDYSSKESIGITARKIKDRVCHKIIKILEKRENVTGKIQIKRDRKYKKMHQELLADIEATKIMQVIEHKRIDTLISIALPFAVHEYASKVKQNVPEIKWVPVSFDPYAFDEVTNAHRKEACIAEEVESLQFADRILFLTQFKNDYRNSVLKEKIDYFELPNIRKMGYDPAAGIIPFQKDKINCVFLGNLYLIQRHPQFLFELFYGMKNQNITLYIVGDLVDLPKEYIDGWVEKFNGRLIYTGRVSQQKAINAMIDADILINIGHATTNQCPSKILDYMSTGKPVLSISKIDNCTSLPYFEHYPYVLSLFEKDGVTLDVITQAEKFILDYKNIAPIEYEQVVKLFEESTMDHMIQKLEIIK